MVVLCNERKNKISVEKNEIGEFIIFGSISAHFSYQRVIIRRGLFYSCIKVPSLLQFSQSQSEGPLHRVTFLLLFFPLDGVFLEDRFSQFPTVLGAALGIAAPCKSVQARDRRSAGCPAPKQGENVVAPICFP